MSKLTKTRNSNKNLVKYLSSCVESAVVTQHATYYGYMLAGDYDLLEMEELHFEGYLACKLKDDVDLDDLAEELDDFKHFIAGVNLSDACWDQNVPHLIIPLDHKNFGAKTGEVVNSEILSYSAFTCKVRWVVRFEVVRIFSENQDAGFLPVKFTK